MGQSPISLQLMDPDCNPFHTRAYTVPRSLDLNCNRARKFQDWWTLKSLKKNILLNGLPVPTFEIPKKNGTIIKLPFSGSSTYSCYFTHLLSQRLGT
jgi:hypothetical protein